MSNKTRARGEVDQGGTLILDVKPQAVRDLGLDVLLEAALTHVSQRQTLLRWQAQVTEFFSGDETKCQLWFAADNPMLGGISPLQMIRMGRLNRLGLFIDESISGNAPPASPPA
jgi:hypothetical protein